MPQFDFVKNEKKILKFWDKDKTFEKSLRKKFSHRDFVFYDGPPFATGTPHYGHLVASLMKDIVPRYWTMKGYHVERKWGWDCHGLPIENIVEQKMKIKSKKQIEKLGIGKFNKICRGKVLIYAEEWKKIIHRFGRWVDMDNCYKTMDKDYMESVWWVFKELWDKGLIYESHKSMHVCPRCGTTLSQHEVSEGYKDIEDISVIVKFELIDQPGVYVLAWTTTPWTLPGNVALAVGEKLKYVLVESGKEKFICVEQNLESVFANRKYKILKEVNPKELEGRKYKPLFDYYLNKDIENKQNLYTIQLADFITAEDGTGIVHIAPAFGEDDMNLGNEKQLPFIQHIKMDGRFTDDVIDFKGQEVKPKSNPVGADKKVLKFLTEKGLVFKEILFTHSYPHCWRCNSPLLNYATSSLFVNVTKIKEQAVETAKSINWIPAHIKNGRFGKWLEGAKDWSISRQRFWGSVIPLWVCDKCGEKKVFGSVKELEKVSREKVGDLHKDFVDKITFKCEKCDGVMRRVPDVLDCWFESGSMPYAQMHYPFENKEKFEKNFPAQFIAEGVDQTRAWFYYLHILATALKGTNCFKNVVANGMVLAEDGKKMSKHLDNYPDPMEMMEKYGADAVRYYLTNSAVMKAEDLNFSEKDLKEQHKFFSTLVNVHTFYQMFKGNIKVENNIDKDKDIIHVLDKWIASKLNLLIKNVTERMDNYDLNVVREIPVFINDLSSWYIRRSRLRFREGNKDEKIKALKTLRKTLFDLSRVMAPFMPFLAEYIYQELGGKQESVHLQDWPLFDEDLIDEKLLSKMQVVRKICELGHKLRAQAKIKVRQPLSKLNVLGIRFPNNLMGLIKDELNVKEVEFVQSPPKGDNWQEVKEGDIRIYLNIEITPILKEEGDCRELVRAVNALRKKSKLTKDDLVNLYCSKTEKSLEEMIQNKKEFLKSQTGSKNIIIGEPEGKILIQQPVSLNGIDVILTLIQ
ncbi:isoleucine--tRNA ligase [Candidatus Parcubacteria bacterium 4484_255]|nr:MAG: isoleucine--tRNA ligase [Candidatus Parcubacteria bacterium 4484_255]